jgi:peptidoglycan/LPS O-acetylase OafA/YrhL
MKYRPEVDGLRSIAVLLVFIFHFEVLSVGKAGFIGVDIFFVISGFLISSIIWGQLESGRFTLKGFYLRRFRRLAPALICLQILLIAFSYALLLPQETKDLAIQNLSTQAYVINFYLWRNVSYFGMQSDSVVLLHCWSLAIEEQFYLLYPLLLIAIHRYARRRFVYILAALTIGSFLLNVLFIKSKPQATFYLLPTRAWELLLGAIIPFAQGWFVDRRNSRQIAALVGTGMIVAGVGLYQPTTAFPGYYALLPTLGTVAIFLASAGGGAWVTRVLSVKPLVYLGQISYSMYLVHWPVKVLAAHFLPDYSIGWRWATLFLALVLSMGLYHAVEDPLRKGKFFEKPSRFLLSYAVGFSTVVLLAIWALYTDGWRQRFSQAVLKVADAVHDQDDASRACEYHPGAWPGEDGPCRIGADKVAPTWAILGDSHAWALTKAFSLALDRRHEAGIATFVHACMPIDGVGSAECQAFHDKVVAWLEGQPTISNVVLVSIWRPYEGVQTADGRFLKGDSALAPFQAGLTSTLVKLRKAGKHAFVWEPLPVAKMSVPSALARNQAFGINLAVRGSRAEYESRMEFMKQALANNRELVSGSFSSLTTMCAEPACLVEEAGFPLYFDNNHPAFSRAPFFAKIIEQQLPALPTQAIPR